MSPNVSRRRFLAITVAAAAAGLVLNRIDAASVAPHVWTGTLLGAEARLTLFGERDLARAAVAGAVAEARRLEGLFSLFEGGSLLSRLNREGEVRDPHPDFVRLVGEAARLSRITGGAFDVTVQPLWTLYSRHFSDVSADPAGPPAAQIEAARSLVGWRGLAVDAARAGFERPGMAATFNGIAQGFVTDRVTETLQRLGFAHVLASFGEFRAGGPKPDGSPWRIGVSDGRGGVLDPPVELVGSALATSSASGMRFDAAGRMGHIIEPVSGWPSEAVASVTVRAPSAAVADGLSTAIAAGGSREAPRWLEEAGAAEAFIMEAGGGIAHWTKGQCTKGQLCFERKIS